jgi:hypothetical protein
MSNDKAICQDALNLIGKHGTTAEASRVSGIPCRTLGDRVDRAVNKYGLRPGATVAAEPEAARAAPAEAEPKALLDADRKLRAAKNEQKDLAAKLKASEEENDELQKRLELLQEIEDGQTAHTTHIENVTPKDGQGVFMGMLSDVHCEGRVDPATIPGYDNEYNPEICAARMTRYFQSYTFLLDAWRSVGHCDTAVLALLGDFLENAIHPDLMASTFMTPAKALLFIEDIVNGGIEHILSHGKLKKLLIPCVHGNHGRFTEEMRIQTSAGTSLEYLMYQQMARYWSREKRIEFMIAEGYSLPFKIYNTNCLIHHGDALKSWNGQGGLTIPLNKLIQRWNVSRAEPIHWAGNGHTHVTVQGNLFNSNGSVIGYGAYPNKMGCEYEPPQQTALWFDSKCGRTMTGRMYL